MARRLMALLTAVATLTSGVSALARPAAAALPLLPQVAGTIEGHLWLDRNVNGVHDTTEAAVGAATVKLTSAGIDGLFGTADDLALPDQVAGSDGFYRFTALLPATYRAHVDPTTAPAGTAPDTADPITVVLGSNQTRSDVDFGFRWTASVGDRVWVDTNANGSQDPGEAGLGGVALILSAAGADNTIGTPDDEAVGTTASDATGAYRFDNLPAGSYRLVADTLSAPPGTATTTPNPLNFTLTPGQAKADANVGFTDAGALGGAAWVDNDANGVRDAGDGPATGVGVAVVGLGPDATLGTGDDIVFPPRTTGTDGRWAAEHLPGGTWQVSVNQASGPAGAAVSGRANPSLVTIAPGAENRAVDFSFRYTGSIGDSVFVDRDGNGQRSASEPGLAGVRLTLRPAGPDNVVGTADDGPTRTQESTAAGGYDFDHLAPGRFRVSVDASTAPAGSSTTTAASVDVDLAPGAQIATVDFGFRYTASIGDRVWLDANANGTQDPGEAGLAGVALSLADNSGPEVVVATTTSGPDGAYVFDHLAPGSYRVSADAASAPAGTVADTANPLALSLAPGQQVTSADMGFRYDGSIGDRVWLDANGDGAQIDGEPGLAGVALALVSAGPDGQLGTGDDVAVGSATSAGDGSYLFANLAPGRYRVSAGAATIPAGATFSTPSVVQVDLAPHGHNLAVDVGVTYIGAIGDLVWLDTNHDGVQGAGEPGQGGVSVSLRSAGPDGVLDTPDDTTAAATTGAAGTYWFTHLAPGRYRVSVDPATTPAGTVVSSPNPLELTLAPGQDDSARDFGLRYDGSIGDSVWLDTNGDGSRGAGEPAVAAAVVHLVGAGPDGTLGSADDVEVGTRSSDAFGAYRFADLAPGTYRVSIDNDSGPSGASVPPSESPRTVVLAAHQQLDTVDFGFRFTGSIGDRVWVDTDGNHAQDPGEGGLGGVTLRLIDAGPDGTFGTADDVVAASTISGADGSYRFSGLRPGRNRVAVDTASAPGGTVPTGPTWADVNLAPRGERTDVDFGMRYTGAIGDSVWVDRNGDGLRDATETGQDGVTVTLHGPGPDGALGTADDTTATAVSTAGGAYQFAYLAPGPYRVAIEAADLPTGGAFTTASSYAVSLVAAENHTTSDFGLRWSGAIGDLVFADYNGNGVADAGEPGIAGAVVHLVADGADNTFGTADDIDWGTRTTGADGTYSFPNLAPDTYRASVDATSAGPRFAATTPVVTGPIALGANEVRADVDFGSTLPEWRTLALNPGAVSIVAGNGLDATVNGTGASASFKAMGGTVVVGGYAYVATAGAIRRVDMATGEATVVAGDATATGCVNATTGAAARFGTLGDMTTDGYYLYVLDTSCPFYVTVRRVSIATGATSTLYADYDLVNVAFGPGRWLYVLKTAPGGGCCSTASTSLVKVDPVTGAATTVVSTAMYMRSYGLASDGQWLWTARGYPDYDLVRIDPASGALTTVATGATTGGLASAGDYLYGSFGTGIRRYTKATGAYVDVAGTSGAGLADGTGTDAWFAGISGLASDGTSLWAADSANRRLRHVVAAPDLPLAQPAVATTTLALNPGAVSSVAGNGLDATVNGTGASASFKAMGGTVVVGGYAYVATAGAIRRVDMATGEATVVAGDATATGCVNATTGAAARFGTLGDMTTDGYYLYVLDTSCPFYVTVRRVSIATGATSTLYADYDLVNVAFGPGRWLYVLKTAPGGGCCSTASTSLVKVDPVTGAATTVVSTAMYMRSYGLASDGQWLWTARGYPDYDLVRIDPASGALTTVATGATTGGLASAGDYLYGSFGTGIRRYTKATGAYVDVAGTSGAGLADGMGASASFSNLTGVASDGQWLWVADSGNRRLRVVAPSAVLMAGSDSFGIDGYAGIDDDVNPALGNYVRSDTEAHVASVGPELAVERTYNSLDSRVGPFGTGWSFKLGMRTERMAAGAVAVIYPDGRREVHKPQPSGAYLPPPGYFSTLSPNPAGGFDLRAKDATTYVFDATGRLVDLADENTRHLAFSYDSAGHLVTVTDAASGRALHLAWTGEHVTAVSTDLVAAHGGPLTWRYAYDGDRLTKVCDPRNNNVATGSCLVYTWSANRITKVIRPKGNTEVELAYQGDARVDWKRNGAGDLTDYAYPTPLRTTVTDGRSNTTTKDYDGSHRLVAETDAAGMATTYEYSAGNRTKVTDANGNASSMAYDTRGNLVSVTDGEGRTSYSAYDGYDNKVFSSDGRSAGPNDATYATISEYDARGNRTKVTTPATADFAAGVSKRWEYSNGTEVAFDGGVVPPGLVLREVDERGKVTTHRYDSAGNERQVVDPSGARRQFTYDELGRRVAEVVYSDTFPAGLTTTTTWTVLSMPASVTSPAVAASAGEAAHQLRTTTTYDANANKATVAAEDVIGTDAPRVVSYAYDGADREISVTDPEAGTMSRTYDGAGNVARVTDAEGRVTRTAYDNRNLASTRVAEGFVDDPVAGSTPRDVVVARTSYDPARRKATETDALGHVRRFSYDHADRLVAVVAEGYATRTGATRDVTVVSRSYDAAGHVVSETTGGTSTTTTAYDPAGRVVSSILDPGGLARTTTFAYDPAGNVVTRTLSGAGRTEQVRFAYDDAGRTTSSTVENGAVDLVTTSAYDQVGNLVSSVDPRGNVAGADPAAFTTTFSYDTAGRRTSTALAPVPVEEGGGAPTTTRPTTNLGYNTYGDVRRRVDARGATTTTTYDRLGRAVRIDHPSYTRPDGATLAPSETFTYDRVGNLVSRLDRRGGRSDFDFDARNRPVRQRDPVLADGTRPTRRAEYDDAGHSTATVDPTGARTESTYDVLGRRRTRTAVVRQPSGPAARYVTTFDYDDRGNLTYRRDPAGAETTWVLDAAAEATATTDAAGKTSTTTYDVAGRTMRATDPLGRATESVYDLAGRLATRRALAPSGAVLATTAFGSDPAGNTTSTTDARGNTTTSAYDAAGRLTQVTQPATATTSVVVSAGYDAEGNRTRTTDGDGHVTISTYTPWDLPESVVEPATAADAAAANRTWTSLYDGAGLAVEERQPGGVSVSRTFDAAGRTTAESGTGPGVAPATRSFAYDAAGHMTSASHPGGSLGLSYDDRGLLAAATGPAGDASFAYDAAGRMTQRTDAAGTAAFTWSARGELASATDPLTTTTRTYAFDDAGQLADVASSGGATRHYGYDDQGHLATATLTNATGAATESEAYAYDPAGNLVTRTTTGTAAAGIDAFSYDRAGRLVSWTKPDATTVAYTWDGAGNRTSTGGVASTYDERNRLVAGPDGTRTWSPRGTLATLTAPGGATTAYSFDALGRLAGAGGVSYAYDSLDRVSTRNAQPFSYAGTEADPVSDGSTTWSRSPSGDLMAQRSGATSALVGRDRHGDVTHLYSADGTVLASQSYDPFGAVVATTGTLPITAGFQGDWTDPSTAQVWMGARWYDSAGAIFDSRDTVTGGLASPVSLNRYTYSFDSPLNYFDADGHWPSFVDDAVKSVGRAVKSTGRAVAGGAGAVVGVVKTASTVAIDTVSAQIQRGQAKLALAGTTLRQVAADWSRGARSLVGDWKAGAHSIREQSRGIRATDVLGGLRGAPGRIYRSERAAGAHSVDQYINATGQIPKGLDLFNASGANPVYRAMDKCTGAVTGFSAMGCAQAVADTATTALAAAKVAGVVENGLKVGSAAAESATAGEPRPAVIGEGMGSRVGPYAEAHGYETYAGLENPQNYTSEELLAHNRAQIEAWKAEGRAIHDVGPEPGRAYYPMETSPNYGMEHNLVRGYAGYQPVVLPGEANWWEALFVH